MMTQFNVSEVQVVAVKPENGLVGFASVVINESLYLGSIGIHSRPDGTFRITYPSKKVGSRNLDTYYPINRDAGLLIERAILQRCDQIFKRSDDQDDRYHKTRLQDGQPIGLQGSVPAKP